MADIRHLLDKIRKAIYGKEVRGSLADGLEAVNNEVEDATEVAVNVEQRQDAVEQQFDTLLSEWSDDKPIDNAETIAARTNTKESKTYENLGKRLDEEYGKVTEQLADADDYRRFESMINRKDPSLLGFSWVDDDGNKGVYTKLYPLAKEYGIKITSALITNNLEGTRQITAEERNEMHESGLVEFMSHSHYHDTNNRPINMTEEELDYDFRTSQKIIKELGYNYRGLVLPFGDNSDLIQKVARRYYDYVIGTGAAMAGSPQYPGEIDNYYIWRVTVQHGFEFVKEQLDEAAEQGVGWIVFVSHVDQGNWYSEEYVRQIIEYTLSLGFKSLTTEEGIRHFGNIAQFGSNKIGADGFVHGNELGRVQYRPRSKGVDHNTPITSFPKNVLSFTDINVPLAPNFPTGNTGVLYTYRYNVDVYSYQKYVTTREYVVFTRFWDDTNKKWKEWKNTSPVQYLGLNAISPETPPSDPRLLNKITHTFINAQHNVGFPENKSGELITNALMSSGFANRTYKIYQSNRTYTQHWLHNENRWSDWKNVLDLTHQEDLIKIISRTVPAKGTIDEMIEANSINKNQIISVQPEGLIEQGIVWNAYVYGERKIVIRIANVTESDIKLANRVWKIQRIEH